MEGGHKAKGKIRLFMTTRNRGEAQKTWPRRKRRRGVSKVFLVFEWLYEGRVSLEKNVRGRLLKGKGTA